LSGRLITWWYSGGVAASHFAITPGVVGVELGIQGLCMIATYAAMTGGRTRKDSFVRAGRKIEK
jgi:hypothetical protein